MAVWENHRPNADPARPFIRIVPRIKAPWPAREIDPAPARGRIRPCPELDCLRGRLPPGRFAAAEQRAARVGVGADRVLIAAGDLDEDTYVRALARSLDIEFEGLLAMPREACPLDDERLIEAAAAGILPLSIAGAAVLVVAPRGIAARRLSVMLAERPYLRSRFRLTTAERLNRFVHRNGAQAIGSFAADALRDRYPALSAGAPLVRRGPAYAGMAALGGACLLAPELALIGIDLALASLFLAWIAFRLVGAATSAPAARGAPGRADDDLPVYSIIIALYDEAAAAPGLIASMLRLDYPAEKLDIKLVVEPDDAATRAAIMRAAPGSSFEVIVAPPRGPRTKPKALNAALPFVRGPFVAVYDAEDRPEPGQLRAALAQFDAADERLACVQAALTIDNTEDNWLTRSFTAEYAGLFDVLLPGLARHRLPLPLGGSSNHFRTPVLREVGAWDAYNVTEDADLGMRLARAGYRSTVVASTTYEEAPARLMPWLRQRTRWFKGWMQTWLVHMRHPVHLARDLGPSGFAAFQLMVGGSVLSALVHPFFLAALVYWLATGSLFATEPGWFAALLAALHGGALAGGYIVSAVLGLLGLHRRRLLSSSWIVLLMPLHWLLLSLAAWRALIQLVCAPQRWEKTAHGLARTSRRPDARKGSSAPLRMPSH